MGIHKKETKHKMGIRKHETTVSHAPEKFHFHKGTMHDTLWVQRRHNSVNDDEDHEENPHLNDFLIPHHTVHIETEFEKEQKERSIIAGGTPKPTLARPCRSILHQAECTSRVECASETRERHVSFHQVIVRDYGMILGDHPNCSYGPPVTLEWDYTEYEPLPVDEYEYHHARRRPIRQLLLNYYRRLKLLIGYAGYSEAEVKAATKEVNRIKLRRALTRELLPVRKIEDAIESAGRKFKRLFKKGKERT